MTTANHLTPASVAYQRALEISDALVKPGVTIPQDRQPNQFARLIAKCDAELGK